MNDLSTLRKLRQEKSRWESAIDNLNKLGHFSSRRDPGEEQTDDEKIREAMYKRLETVQKKIFWAKVKVRKEQRKRVA